MVITDLEAQGGDDVNALLNYPGAKWGMAKEICAMMRTKIVAQRILTEHIGLLFAAGWVTALKPIRKPGSKLM